MGEMSDELFHKIIKEGKEMKAAFFSPFLNGEPFVFSRMWKWLDYMEKEGVQTVLYTNGEFLDVDRLIKYKNIRYVNCSFNGATKETYDKVMRRPDYDTCLKNIKELVEKAPFNVKVSMVVTEDNQHETELFKKMWGTKRKMRPFLNWAGGEKSSIAKIGGKKPCYSLLQHMTILWDGRVVPCCMDWDGEMILGDVNKNTLKEIWDSYEWMREKHKNLDFDIPICKKCNFNCDGK
jgi:radical SAM protein with 4Fe4S-binding SPASM domain